MSWFKRSPKPPKRLSFKERDKNLTWLIQMLDGYVNPGKRTMFGVNDRQWYSEYILRYINENRV